MIEAIRQKFAQDRFEFSRHAVDRMLLRDVIVQEVREAVANGEVIEDYPQDKYGASCLIGGFTGNGRPLHIQCSYPDRSLIKVVTVYEPDPNEWINFKARVL
ncbi:MAG: DUF4258 domain-containing protein [Chloroflexi bacterium]|nr:DUF4258 domain-containing protein [Chloroflexota bacterium]